MSKGQQTRETILARAVGLASEVGLGGLTIGGLAADLGMSKSGLFAHFGSKEALQQEVLRKTMEQFVHAVVEPAQSCAPGERRVRALFQNWLSWSRAPDLPGGCPFVGASAEFDSQSGPVRDVVASTQRQWVAVLVQAVEQSLGDDFPRDLDPERFAFELYGIYLTHHLYRQLLDEQRAERWAQTSFEELIERARKPQRAHRE